MKLSFSSAFLFSLAVANDVQAMVTEQTCKSSGIFDTEADTVLDTSGGGLRHLQTAREAVITNGHVVLGVLQAGGLNTDTSMGYTPADPFGSIIATSIGLRYVAADGKEYEATSWGCPCEGWGVATDTDLLYTNKARTTSIGTATFTDVTPNSAISTTTSAGGGIKVVHDFHPSPDTPYLYEVVVTITNKGATDTSKTLYRRLFDFDVPPNVFTECVTVQPDPSTVDSLLRATNNGFTDANPTSGIKGAFAPLTDDGPADLGATYDFDLGPLPAGESVSFRIFYGGAPNTGEAEAALGAVGAEAYAMGKPSSADGRCLDDGPAVFLFAFAGIGGETIFEAPVAGSHGDPHFKTWTGKHFEYHGQCDLVLAKDPNFADDLGLDLHIRTKLVRFWSYIKNAVIKIGDDILEIEGSSMEGVNNELHYWFNFEYQGKLTEFAGFPVTIKSSKGSKNKKNTFEIDLSSKYPGHKIVIQTFNEFVKVDFIGDSEEAFGNIVGMMGDFKTGKTVARDGATVLDDLTDFGREWQVLPDDSKLFRELSEPQFPKLCDLPEDPRGNRARRLDESAITVEQAEAACAALKNMLDRKDCVYDILATQNLEMAGAF